MPFKKKNSRQNSSFNSITISLCSPDDILERSFGEVEEGTSRTNGPH